MGKGKNSFLAFLGLKKCGSEENQSGENKYHQDQRKVRPSEEDGPWWYGEPDIDRKSRDYINHFHHGINSQTD
jgi:hypothetical protein